MLREPVRADHHVDLAAGQPVEHAARLLGVAEPREMRDFEGEFGHPAAEGPQMLLAKDRRGHEHAHLIAGVDGLEGRPHRHFGLAVADVAAEQPVHRMRREHVALDGPDRIELVDRLVVGKRGVEFALPKRIRRKADSRQRRAGGLQLDHLHGDVGHGQLGRLLLPLPGLSADGRKVGPSAAAADVLLHHLNFRDRHVDLRAAAELQLEMFFGLLFVLEQLQSAVAADAVADVHDQVAFAQVEEAVDRAAQPPPRRPGHVGPPEQLPGADQNNPLVAQPEAVLQMSHRKMEPAVGRQVRRREHFFQPLGLGLRLANEVDVVTGRRRVEFVPHPIDVAAESLDRFELQMTRGLVGAGRDGLGRDVRKAGDLPLHFVDGVIVLRPVHAGQEMPRLVAQVGRLDQQEGGVLRQIRHEMIAVGPARLEHGNVQRR